MAVRTIIETKNCTSKNECIQFERFINSLEQVLGKPRHVSRVGRVNFEMSMHDNMYEVEIRGDKDAVNIAQQFIRDF